MKLHEDELNEMQIEIDLKISKGVQIAKNNNINFTKFKQEITPYLDRSNDEDQWTYAYESYLLSLAALNDGYNLSINEFANEFYGKDFKNEII